MAFEMWAFTQTSQTLFPLLLLLSKATVSLLWHEPSFSERICNFSPQALRPETWPCCLLTPQTLVHHWSPPVDVTLRWRVATHRQNLQANIFFPPRSCEEVVVMGLALAKEMKGLHVQGRNVLPLLV